MAEKPDFFLDILQVLNIQFLLLYVHILLFNPLPLCITTEGIIHNSIEQQDKKYRDLRIAVIQIRSFLYEFRRDQIKTGSCRKQQPPVFTLSVFRQDALIFPKQFISPDDPENEKRGKEDADTFGEKVGCQIFRNGEIIISA